MKYLLCEQDNRSKSEFGHQQKTEGKNLPFSAVSIHSRALKSNDTVALLDSWMLFFLNRTH